MLETIVKELGLRSLAQASIDAKLLCVQRFVRLAAYGACGLILVLFLSSIGISEIRIGYFLTLTMVGDVVISFILTLFADGIGRRKILVIGAALMSTSGIIFVLTNNFWILLLASIIGVISPSGNEIGPFRAIEESTLAQLVPKEQRSDVFAWYSMIGMLGAAMGQLVTGWVMQKLQTSGSFTPSQTYRAAFVAYAALGLLKLVLAMLLSSACEENSIPKQPKPTALENQENDEEAEAFLREEQDGNAESQPPLQTTQGARRTGLAKLVPRISSESRGVLLKLCLLFMFDSFASGLVSISWISYFFERKFALASGTLGTLFFACSLVAAASTLVAASMSRRIGLVKTMVFTHLPSSIFLGAIPFPNQKWFAMAFLFLRFSTSTMDQAPRQAFISAAVLQSERTAVMGIVNVVKAFAQSGAPTITGWLAQKNVFWVAFVLAGGLKASYDIAMLLMFRSFEGRS